MKNFIKSMRKSVVDVIFKDKTKGNKISYYYNLVGIAIFPMWLVMGFWILLEWLIEGKITESLVDNLVAFLCCIASFITMLVGMFIGRELKIKEQQQASFELVESIEKQIEKEDMERLKDGK